MGPTAHLSITNRRKDDNVHLCTKKSGTDAVDACAVLRRNAGERQVLKQPTPIAKSNKPLASDASSSFQRGKEHVAVKDKKRIRSGTSTEETPRRDKKPRYGSITTSKSYSHAATNYLRVDVVNKKKTYGKIDAGKEPLVKRQLMEELDKMIQSASSSKTKPPTFRTW